MVRNINVSCIAYFVAALALLILPGEWVFGAILAASAHELAHILMLWLLGGQVLWLHIGVMGAKIETMPMAQGREALCALAGPLGSFLFTWICANLYPEAALCALMQGIFNLLPIYPLDGGRVVRCMFPYAVCLSVEVFTLILLFGLGLWLMMGFDLGILPIIPAWIALMQRIPRKIPCKEPKLAVQ